MALEDFTTYTEVDVVANRVSVAANKLTVTGLDGDELVQVYDDKGAGHFATTFDHDVKVTPQSETGLSDPTNSVWTVANTTSGHDDHITSAEQAVLVDLRQDTDQIRLIECEALGIDVYDKGSDYNGDVFYLSCERTGDTTMALRIYSDAARTALTDTLLVAIPSGRSYRYIFGLNAASGVGTGRVCAIDVEDLDLQEAAGTTHTLTQAENMALATTPTRQADIYRALSSTVATSTAQALASTFQRLQADTAGISDAATRQAAIVRALADNASLADAIVRQVDILRAIADTAGLSDTPTRQSDAIRAIIDTLGLSDSVAAAIAGVGATHLLSLIEQLSAADSVTANRHVYPPQRIMAKGIFSPGMVAAQIRGFQQ